MHCSASPSPCTAVLTSSSSSKFLPSESPPFAAVRRRALEALRRLIAEGKTVLFISHDMWNVRRLCSDILWMEEGRVRAYGPAGEIAERYMNEINIEALANQSVNLQSHRGGTGEIRYSAIELVDEAGRPAA